MLDIIKCKDCKYLQRWRTSEQAEKFGQIYECEKEILSCPEPDDYCSKAEAKESNYIKDTALIDDKLEDLSKRVETIEKQMKEDKEEQLKKLEAELNYAKFCCSLPTIQRIMGSEE